MPEELATLLADLEDAEKLPSGDFVLYRGVLEQQPVLIAQCGIGKVNAAALTQLMLLKGASSIIFTGVAGALAPELDVGDIVISTDAVQHDLDVTALGYEPGQIPGESFSWSADEQMRNVALAAAQELNEVKVVSGRIASGDQFIASPAKVANLRETFAAACAEMEGASVAQVCAKSRVPFVIIRSISDTADHDASVNFREFTPLAAKRAKHVVRAMLRRLKAA